MKTEAWSSRLTFLFATISCSVGLGNLWRFPYVAGENRGGLSLGNDPVNDSAPIVPGFKEQELWNYELVFESEFADNTVRMNGSTFSPAVR